MKFWEIFITKESAMLFAAEEECEKMMDFIFGYGESFVNEWDSTLEVYVKEGSIYDSDVFRFSSTFFVINNKAKKIFDLFVKKDIEYLDINCKDGELVIANPITVIDCINMEASKYKVYKGNKDLIQFFDRIDFKNGVIGNVNLFIAKHLENNIIICSNLFKEAIEKNNIRGFGFKYINECEI